MLTPNDVMKKKEFARAVRGYNPADVDKYIETLKQNYLELYQSYQSTKLQLNQEISKNRELSTGSEQIRAALLGAQKASEKIIREAKEKADIIVKSSKSSCDNAINEFRMRIIDEKEKLLALQDAITDFKDKSIASFENQLDKIREIGEVADWSDLDLDDEAYTKKVINDIKGDVAYEMSLKEFDIEDDISFKIPSVGEDTSDIPLQGFIDKIAGTSDFDKVPADDVKEESASTELDTKTEAPKTDFEGPDPMVFDQTSKNEALFNSALKDIPSSEPEVDPTYVAPTEDEKAEENSNYKEPEYVEPVVEETKPILEDKDYDEVLQKFAQDMNQNDDSSKEKEKENQEPEQLTF